MGGRGGSSMSSGGVSHNAKLHEKFMAGELGTKVTKNDKFMMENAFPDMNYSRTRLSKSSSYARADRVSPDGNHISVMVPSERIRETPYGYALTLDSGNVQYLKTWQVSAQTLPHKGQVGVNVSMSKQYFKPKPSRVKNEKYGNDPKQLKWDEWLKAAKKQQRAGNTVSIRM